VPHASPIRLYSTIALVFSMLANLKSRVREMGAKRANTSIRAKHAGLMCALVAAVDIALVCSPGIVDRIPVGFRAVGVAGLVAGLAMCDNAMLTIATAFVVGLCALRMQNSSDWSWRTAWKRTGSSSVSSPLENFAVGAPYHRDPTSTSYPGLDVNALARGASSRGYVGAGADAPVTEEDLAVREMVEFNPPELIAAAQSNAVPPRPAR